MSEEEYFEQFEEDLESEDMILCPNCNELKPSTAFELLTEPWNTDEVCDDCILECGYYE